MPYEGAMMQQPHGVIERFETILGIIREDEMAEIEKAKHAPPPA